MTQLSIIFLGTGGSWPTQQRNVAATAVKRGGDITLFDCGEGTQRQIQKTSLSYMQIQHIFITHFHGDHFLGLPGLIQTMQLNDREQPLHIYGPPGMIPLTKSLLSLGYFNPSYQIIAHELEEAEETLEFDDYTVTAIKANHNVPSLSYCLKEETRPGKFNKPKALELGVPEGPLFSKLQKGNDVTLKDGTTITSDQVLGPPRPGRKIVISADTRPYDALIDLAKDADVLIHEATFASDFKERAAEYGHSTARQAAEVAKKADVDRLYLMHVSPRYLKGDPLEKEAQEVFADSVVPQDFDTAEVPLKK